MQKLSQTKEDVMYSRTREFLVKNRIIGDIFEYQDLDPEKVEIYAYFQKRFKSLFKSYAKVHNLGNYFFYLKNNISCNAFASRIKGRNIIGITNGYPILMTNKFDEKFFSKVFTVALINGKYTSDAYCELYEEPGFKFNLFMLECSIRFTFGHEFRHILQFKHSKTKNNFSYSENLDTGSFDITRHVWEFDADRIASFEVLKYIFREFVNLKNKNIEILRCMIYIGLASMTITKSLFYFGVANHLNPDYVIKQEFYTEKFLHPHPLVRIFNIFEYFHDNIKTDFPELKIDTQELLNNSLGIMKIYFDQLLPNQTIINDYFNDMHAFLDNVHAYNGKLYDLAIKDESIRSLLKSQGVTFESM